MNNKIFNIILIIHVLFLIFISILFYKLSQVHLTKLSDITKTYYNNIREIHIIWNNNQQFDESILLTKKETIEVKKILNFITKENEYILLIIPLNKEDLYE